MRRPNRVLFPLLALTGLVWLGTATQREGPPRRVENPTDFDLPHGSRVEFHSFYAPSLGRQGAYSVFLPPTYGSDPNRKFPVVYFLHGSSNDHTSWTVERYGDLPAVLDRLLSGGEIPEFLMVHPRGENSFYVNRRDASENFEDFVRVDVEEEVRRRFRVRRGRPFRSIAGTSMGGYGALKIALRHPRHYASVVADSPIVLLGDDPLGNRGDREGRGYEFFRNLLAPIYGDPIDLQLWRENSLEHLAKSAYPEGLNIYFTYGTADRYNQVFPMEEGVRRLSEILSERRIPHAFLVFDGWPHGWELLQAHFEEAVRFLTQTFE